MWFVVGMFCIATFLYLYKGFSVGENYALNLAAVFSVLVACYPMEWNCLGELACRLDKFSYCFKGINPHGLCAAAMFVCLAYVMFFRAMDTLPALGNSALEKNFRVAYYATGSTMILFPLTAGILHLVKNDFTEVTFYLEMAGIWAFALYWAVKSVEMRYSQRA
ncbi:hypothetical protein DBR42_06700 [Pelomonas sp. HMWF004]|nr:hypothetical protein DBR42_06700 [Pelomonas sp. HMWF004]